MPARRLAIGAELAMIMSSFCCSCLQPKRSLWLASRRGRAVEAVKRWLVRHRLWSSARQRVVEPALPPLMKRYRWILWLLFWPLAMADRLTHTTNHQRASAAR